MKISDIAKSATRWSVESCWHDIGPEGEEEKEMEEEEGEEGNNWTGAAIAHY